MSETTEQTPLTDSERSRCCPTLEGRVLTPLSPALAKATPQEAVTAAAVQGAFTILDLFDALPWFKPARDWLSWRAVLAASFGLPMSEKEQAIFRECTGRMKAPTKPAREVNVIVGRRGGKSRVVGSVVVPFFALYRDYSGILAPGERCTIPVLAKDKDDAQAILGYCKATFGLEAFKGFVARELAEGLALTNRVDIAIKAAKITAARSRTVPAAACDEIAFWPTDDSASPDKDILEGIRPAQITVPGAMIFKLSSPYAERGVLFNEYLAHYGKDDDRILVWKAPTLKMHPNNPQVNAEVLAAYEADPVAAAAEYGAEFRKDVQAFVTREAVRDATILGRREVSAQVGKRYFAFVDPSGGASDSFTLGIAEWDHARRKVVLDMLYEVTAPFDPEKAVDVIVEKIAPYKCTYVTGDAYAGEWPRAAFLKHGIAYHVSEKPKSRIYVDFLPLLNSGSVELLDHARLATQLVGLDRKTARGGRDSIDHLPGAKDDCANSVAGACVLASEQGRYASDEQPEKQYLTPEGQPDFLALRREQLAEAVRKAKAPPEDEGTPRYGYQP